MGKVCDEIRSVPWCGEVCGVVGSVVWWVPWCGGVRGEMGEDMGEGGQIITI